MDGLPIDVCYGLLLLGLPLHASFEDIKSTQTNAENYKFSTRERLETVRQVCEFFSARQHFGRFEVSFVDLRRVYHSTAMRLHPDRNPGKQTEEDELKSVNLAFALVEQFQTDAKAYFNLSEDYRKQAEREAKEARFREFVPAAPPGTESSSSERASRPAPAEAEGPKKYMAASVPRFIRNARLGHVALRCIIGSWHVAADAHSNHVFDVVMLPERDFIRMRLHLSVPNVASMALQQGNFAPPYILKDTKEVIVPIGTGDAFTFAKAHFLQAFGIAKPQ